MKVYSVIMRRRWSLRETHSYLIGVFDSMVKAEIMAEFEENHRGGKYKAEIVESDLDEYIVYSDDKLEKTELIEKVGESLLSLPKEDLLKLFNSHKDSGFFSDIYKQIANEEENENS